MDYRKLGSLDVSVIGLGTLRAFDVTGEADLAPRREIIDSLLANDINLIDSAAAYGAAEKAVGITIDGKQDWFYLATRVRVLGGGRPHGSASPYPPPPAPSESPRTPSPAI